jgi:hypothetical protein
MVRVIAPRIRRLAPALATRGGELFQVTEDAGMELDDWQQLFLNDAAAVDELGALAAFEVSLLVARQCGKTRVGEVYSLFWALQGEHVLYTSHRADTARVVFERLSAVAESRFGAHVVSSNGRERLDFPSGGSISFRTRSGRLGRGHTLDKVVIDEAQVCDPDHVSALIPTMRTRPGAQVLYLACAPDARSNGNCVVLYELRQRALAGDSALTWLEWSADARDAEGNELQAHELPEEMLDDPKLRRQATPAPESRIPMSRLEQEREAFKRDPAAFAVEILSIGIWPDLAAINQGPISSVEWDELADPASTIPDRRPAGVSEVVVGFDTSPARWVWVTLAGVREDGDLHGEVAGRFQGADEAVRGIGRLFDREDIDIRAVVADGEAANLDILNRLERELFPGSGDGARATASRYLRREGASRAGTQACGVLVDLVGSRAFRHRGQQELSVALRGAVVKQLGEAWVFSRSRSKSDVSPLLALACALHTASVELEPAGAAGLTIH